MPYEREEEDRGGLEGEVGEERRGGREGHVGVLKLLGLTYSRACRMKLFTTRKVAQNLNSAHSSLSLFPLSPFYIFGLLIRCHYLARL